MPGLLQETALFEIGYRKDNLFDRNPLIKVCQRHLSW